MIRKFDLICIGAGSGGLSCSKHAARMGKNVALVESDARLGGTCLLHGCIPKKILYNAAVLKKEGDYLFPYGICAKYGPIQWQELKRSMDHYIKSACSSIKRRIDSDNISLIHGIGSLKSPNEVCVRCADGREEVIYGDNIVLSCGTQTAVPSYTSGFEHMIDNIGLFSLKSQPKSVVIIGGGYIGTEFTTILSLMGTKVHWIIKSSLPLKFIEKSLARVVTRNIANQGVSIYNDQYVKDVEKVGESSYQVTLNTDNTIVCDQVIWAGGREPNTQFMSNGRLQVPLTSTGRVAVDNRFRVKGYESLWCIGDLLSTPNLTPVAIAQGRAVANYLYSDGFYYNADLIPTTVYCYPPLSVCGLTEYQAKEQLGINGFFVKQKVFRDLHSAVGDNPCKTYISMIFSSDEEKLLGIQIYGPKSDEMIQGFVLAMHMGATLDDLRSIVPIHPTIAEEIFSV